MTVKPLGIDPSKIYVGGSWVSSQNTDPLLLVNPSDGSHLCEIAAGNAADIDAAVLAARAALGGNWGRMTAPERGRILARTGQLVSEHIDELASKEYTNLSSLHSPDFILMFMPIEPAYIEAMKHDTELFSYGYAKNVILVSHTTLVPILRTVANLWMLDRSNKEARLIGEKASDIYNSVATVSERLAKLGKTLNTASTHYNDTVTSLSGVQGLQGKVTRFSELSSKATKTMPELEEKNIEFETSKLQANALPEPSSEPSTDLSTERKEEDQ